MCISNPRPRSGRPERRGALADVVLIITSIKLTIKLLLYVNRFDRFE